MLTPTAADEYSAIRLPPRCRPHKRPVYLGIGLRLCRRLHALLRPRLTVDLVHLAVFVLGIPGAYAAGRDCRLVAGSVRHIRVVQICRRRGLYDCIQFFELSLLGAKDMG